MKHLAFGSINLRKPAYRACLVVVLMVGGAMLFFALFSMPGIRISRLQQHQKQRLTLFATQLHKRAIDSGLEAITSWKQLLEAGLVEPNQIQFEDDGKRVSRELYPIQLPDDDPDLLWIIEVHPAFPGNAARILRKKYSSSR